MLKKCFHCNAIIPENLNIFIKINEIDRFMCCNGCLTVAEFIINSGFSDYYSYRSSYNISIDQDFFNKKEKIDNNKENLNQITLSIEGITCSACTWLIERHLMSFHGISNIYINLFTCKANISYDSKLINIIDIINEIKKIGYLAHIYNLKKQEEIIKNENKKEIKKLLVSGICMSQVMMLSFSVYVGEVMDMYKNYWIFIRWMSLFFTIPVLFFSGSDIMYNALKKIAIKNFSMDLTVSLSLIIAFLISIWNVFLNFGDIYFDSICMFIFFLKLSKYLEMKARHHSINITIGLQKFIKKNANIVKKKNILNIPIENIKVKDIVIVKVGELIPVDGKIKNGSGYINESLITGESIPVYKSKNDFVLAGSININGLLFIQTLKTQGNSTIDLITSFLEKAQNIKPKYNLLSDIISGYFINFVIFLTFLSSFVWIKICSENLINIVLCMFAVSCPCALSLATPIALSNSVNALAKRGFLIKKEHVLENLHNVTDVVFDKTGTLTINNFIINKIKLAKRKNLLDIINIAVILEENSNHAIAKAFMKFKKYKEKKTYNVNYINFILNKGVEGKINNIEYRIGSEEFVKNWTKNNFNFTKLNNGVNIFLVDKESLLAIFNLINPVRNNLKECIENLKNLNLKLHIISGDSSKEVELIAKKYKIFNQNKSFTPEEKLNYIKTLKKNGSRILMIGDGINDVLALNSSDISVSMGSASDLTKNNSDIILLNNDLLNISNSIKHSIKSNKIIKQNIIWSIFYNLFGLFFASFNLLTPYYAALGMSISSLIVIFNSLRLKNI